MDLQTTQWNDESRDDELAFDVNPSGHVRTGAVSAPSPVSGRPGRLLSEDSVEAFCPEFPPRCPSNSVANGQPDAPVLDIGQPYTL